MIRSRNATTTCTVNAGAEDRSASFLGVGPTSPNHIGKAATLSRRGRRKHTESVGMGLTTRHVQACQSAQCTRPGMETHLIPTPRVNTP